MEDKKIILIATIIFLILFIFFLSTRYEKIIIGNNKLQNNYIKIYENEENTILTEFLDINYITQNDKKYTLKSAIENEITTIDNIGLQSTKKDILHDGTVIYYFDKNSKISTNNDFQIIFCSNNITYIISKFNLENNVCLKTIN